MTRLAALALIFAMTSASAYDANGVALGSTEADVNKRFPNITCQALQWSSRAADRRCDDRAVVGGVNGRITFYLKDDRVQAFDMRFDTIDTQRLAAHLKSRYGAPASEKKDKVYKAEWRKGAESAVLVAQSDKRRGFFTVSRGDFEEEIYRAR